MTTDKRRLKLRSFPFEEAIVVSSHPGPRNPLRSDHHSIDPPGLFFDSLPTS